MITETIAAVATPHGTGGISVIRVSGDDAFIICDRIFRNPKGKKLADAKSHTILYGHITDGEKIIDEVLVSVMRAPHTFTGENTAEINCHGGITVTNAVLSALLKNGAVLASKGEFTKRAFLNGRMDLSQAEAVIDVINSTTSLALDTATHQLEGSVSREIAVLRDKLLDVMAQIDVAADYPEEEIDEIGENQLLDTLKNIASSIKILEESAERGTLIRDGINTVICGKPNVGKSSLLNALADNERAIVTDIAGTTRDVIEERVTLSGIALNIFDTAGIRDSDNPVESIGITKATEYLKKADLVLFLIDASSGVTEEDIKISKLIKDKKTILIINKSDLNNDADVSDFKNAFPTVYMSAKQGIGIDKLSQMIEEMFNLGEISKDGSVTITNLRHKQALSSANMHLGAAISAVGTVPFDLIGIDITNAISALGEITGQTVSEEIVDRIFSRFCLGK
jgi:tRNA modification GTPase